MPLSATPPVRVVVRLPYNRPDNAPTDPPPVEWNTEKETILWEVIARSRGVDSGGTDWSGLAAHLEVPLPYLLFRAQVRYEEDLRGLQGIRGPLTPLAVPPVARAGDAFPGLARPEVPRRSSGGASQPSASTLLPQRTRLSSQLRTPAAVPRKAVGSSTATLRGLGITRPHVPLEPPSPSDSGSDDDEEAERAEAAEREREAQDELVRKLRNLQASITDETLGLVRTNSGAACSTASVMSSSSRGSHGRVMNGERGRVLQGLRLTPAGADREGPRSASISSADSPRGSIPDIPSPPLDPQFASPARRGFSQGKSTSPPLLSPRSVRGNMRYQALVGPQGEYESTHGSSASSFSDISDLSLSSSALGSGMSSNFRTGSRLSNGRSRFTGRTGGRN